MKTLSGLLWALGGGAAGLVLGGLIGLAIAKLTEMPSREGASAYFVVLVAVVGALLGVAAGMLLYGRSAPSGQGAAFVGSSALGVVGLIAAVAVGIWVFVGQRETPALYDGAMATLEMELRIRQSDIPAGSGDDWLQLEVQTATTRPEGDVHWSRARTEGEMRIIPVSQNPLVRAANRVIMVRVHNLHTELFVPPIKRTPDRHADWSAWYDATSVQLENGDAPPPTTRSVLALRYRIKVYGE